jgi:hypothetical protein
MHTLSEPQGAGAPRTMSAGAATILLTNSAVNSLFLSSSNRAATAYSFSAARAASASSRVRTTSVTFHRFFRMCVCGEVHVCACVSKAINQTHTCTARDSPHIHPQGAGGQPQATQWAGRYEDAIMGPVRRHTTRRPSHGARCSA